MNSVGRMIMQAKLNEREKRHDSRSGNYDSRRDRSYDERNYDARDRERDFEMNDSRNRDRNYDREWDSQNDERRGVRGSGRDRGESMRLSKFDIMRWEKLLKNADGTKGKHFDLDEVEEAAKHLGIRFDEYSEKELCVTMNMLYSDLCEVNRSLVSSDKEAQYYAKLAQAWLEDDDGPKPSEKLALYFYCIADDE